MELVIEIDDSVPAFARPWVGSDVAELVDAVKRAVRRGDMRPGEALPSVRQLANDLGLDGETVAKAYRVLERESVIRMSAYRGNFVHPDAGAHARSATGAD